MLHRFISTPPARVGRPSALAFSIAAHLVVILVLVAPRSTQRWSSGDVADERPMVERVQFVQVAPPSESPPASASAREKPAPARTPVDAAPSPNGAERNPGLERALARLGSPSIKIAIPEVSRLPEGMDAPAPAPASAADSLAIPEAKVRLADIVGGLVGGHNAGVKDGVYLADLVDRIVSPFPNNPKPTYPRSLLSAGVEASFLVHFVVDTTGRVDDRSMEFPTTAHSLFVDAIRGALRRSRYHPAEVGGQRVAQLVEQRFTFQLAR